MGSPNKLPGWLPHYSIPAMFSRREAVLVGGLISYDTNVAQSYHHAGIYVARILNGEKPGDLPIIQPTKFELLLNLRTARALQLNLSPKLLALADQVVE
jgi:putative tryptophan/tyrosine transport system substrate-binding protein